MKNRKNAEKTQPEKSKWCEKPENREKNPVEGMQAGQKNGKTRKTPSRRKASRMKTKKMHKNPQGNQYKIRK